MRIALVISTLEGGGAERVVSVIANWWAAAGEEPIVVTFWPESVDQYPLDSRVERLRLDLYRTSSVGEMIRRVRRLRRSLRSLRADIVVSFVDSTNLLTIASSRGLGVPTAVSERIDPREHRIHWVLRALRRILYRWADVVVVQTEGARRWAQSFLPAERVAVIPNPVRPVPDLAPYDRREREAVVMAMGRLRAQKGFDLLIRAYARVANKHPQWSVEIYGEGDEREHLRRLIAELDLEGRVFLCGYTNHPERILLRAGLFVLPSRYEGFPNVLLEAMAHGLPVIAADCRSGPDEIVRNGVDAVLVPPEDVEALADAMDWLMCDENERIRLASRAPEVIDRFGVEKMMGMWNELLQRLVRERRGSY